MNTNNDLLGEVLERGQGLAGSAGRAAKKQIADTAKAAVSQITGMNVSDKKAQVVDKKTDPNFVKDLYGVKDDLGANEQSNSQNNQQQTQSSLDSTQNKQAQKKVEDQQKIAKLRQQLHQEGYYRPTFEPPKQQEERPAEKVEHEKQQEMQDLQKKELKKPKPIAVQRAQTKAEKFRGASG